MELEDGLHTAVRARGDRTELALWVVPGAARTELVGIHGGALKVRVAAPAEAGKANRAVVRLLEEVLASPVHLPSTRSRSKIATVAAPPERVRERLLRSMPG